MQKQYIAIAILGATISAPALADHNSKWGEGWAKMPNDIHNTRIDTRGDNTTFRDFVRQGNGAESINRFSTSNNAVRSQRTSAATRQQSSSGRAQGRRR